MSREFNALLGTIGIELSGTYLDEIAIPRIEKETQQMRMFN